MKLIDNETGLELTERQAIKCWHLINLIGRGLREDVYLYMPRDIVMEIKDLIREIDKSNDSIIH